LNNITFVKLFVKENHSFIVI